MPKAKRLVVLTDFGVAAGGATSLAIASAVGAKRSGVAVTYVTSEGDIDPALTSAGVEVVSIPGKRVSAENKLEGIVSGLWRKETLELVGAMIRRDDTPDTIYHLHNWGHFLSPSVFRALSPVHKRTVTTTHDFFLVCPNGGQFDFQREDVCELKGGSIACAFTNCDRRSRFDKVWRIIRHTIRSRTYVLRQGRAQVVVIHRGMIPALLRAGVPIDLIREIRNPIRPFITDGRVSAENNHEVLFVGRLSHEKGPDLAARAAVRAGLAIRFIGDGPMRNALEAEFPMALFDGFRTREEIGERARHARMLVMPGRWAEPYGMVAGEALWSGIPVLLSNNALIAQEIVDVGAGLMINPRDTEGFAEAMCRLADDDALTRRMSEQAFAATGALGLTLLQWQDQYLELYDQMLEAAT